MNSEIDQSVMNPFCHVAFSCETYLDLDPF